jgi:hypothetical protein
MMFPNGSDCSSLLKTYPNLCLTKSEVSFLEFKIQKNRQSAVSFLLFKIQHVVNSRIHNIFLTSVAVWCFGTFFVFPYIGNNHPNGLIFFRGVGIPPTSLLFVAFQPWRAVARFKYSDPVRHSFGAAPRGRPNPIRQRRGLTSGFKNMLSVY